MTDRDAPIGIFDSGVGGLTVARAVIDQLPAERVVYVGDTAHGPYGPLPIAEIRRHALALGDALMDRGIKALVVACNSASAACLVGIARLEDHTPLPLLVALLALSGTVRSIGFSAYNSAAFADVEPERMTKANALMSTLQQLGAGSASPSGRCWYAWAALLPTRPVWATVPTTRSASRSSCSP